MNPCTGVMDQITNQTIDVIGEPTAKVSPSPKVVSQNCMAVDYYLEAEGGVYKLESHRECCTFILYHEDLRRRYLHRVKEIQQAPGSEEMESIFLDGFSRNLVGLLPKPLVVTIVLRIILYIASLFLSLTIFMHMDKFTF